MNEIKIRAKDKSGDWQYGLLTYANFNRGVEKAIAVKTELGSILIERIDQKTIGLYTGLKDRYGKEIYEGDIVAINKELLGCYIIKYDENCARFSMYINGYEQAGFNKVTMKAYEVIGNIYDNPELLGVEDLRNLGSDINDISSTLDIRLDTRVTEVEE